MSPGLLCVVGLLITGGGGFLMTMAGYLIGGESRSNPREGVPLLVVGSLVALAGIVSIVVAIVGMVRQENGPRRAPPG